MIPESLQSLWRTAGEISLETFCVLLLALVVYRACRSGSAALRHHLLLLSMLAALCLPLLSLILPRITIPFFSWLETSEAQVLPLLPPGPQTPAETTDLLAWGAPCYLLGFALTATWWLTGRLRCFLLVRQARPLATDRQEAPIREILHALPGGRSVRLRCHPRVNSPLLHGLCRPTLLLPEEAVTWPQDRLRATLLHELGHLRRRDLLWRALGSAACAIHWFNPLAWLVLKKMLEEQELACDRLAVQNGVRPSDYALNLLAAAQRSGESLDLAMAGMGHGKALKHRLNEILAPTRSGKPMKTRHRAITLVGAVLLCGFLATLTPFEEHAAAEPPDSAVKSAISPTQKKILAAPDSESYLQALDEYGLNRVFSKPEIEEHLKRLRIIRWENPQEPPPLRDKAANIMHTIVNRAEQRSTTK